MITRIAGSIIPRLLSKVPKNIKFLYPFYLAGQLNTTAEEYFSPHLPDVFDGISLAFASDIHFGPLFSSDEALRLYHRLLELKTDLVILGGDYGNKLIDSIAFFNLIPSFPDSMKVLAVIGNHDYGCKGESLEPLLTAMQRKNVVPLVNQVFTIKKQNAVLAVCGPDDFRCGKPQFGPLITQSSDADFRLFIPHSPDLIPEAQKAGFQFHLALCGHTHGGQITLFGHSLHSSSRYRDRYRSGWYREQGADILVSNGVGTSILPMRLGTKSEIHRMVLHSKA